MSDEEILLEKRFIELARKSLNSGYFIFTDFLGLREQSVFERARASFGGIPYAAFGGDERSERVMIRFGSEEELGYSVPFPISILKISPRSEKFADKLTHRDFLGAIMNLGIERDTLGDIALINNHGYLFVKDEISEYIKDSLTKIKHTDVTVSIIDTLPEGELYQTKHIRIQANGERVDAVVAKVFSLSRDDALGLFRKGLVFINGVEAKSASKGLKKGDKVSVRGYGRFIYHAYETLSKKGKLNIDIELYI